MIGLKWIGMDGQIGALMAAFEDLPRHIAKKHLRAVMKRALKPGIPVLKRYTPPEGAAKRGRRSKGKRSTGALKRAVITKSAYKGRNKDGYVIGVLGYKGGRESLKAIWMEDGTKFIAPRRMVELAMKEIAPRTADFLCIEMKNALEAAARDKAPGVDQGYRRK